MTYTHKLIVVSVIGSPVPQGSLVGNPRFGGLRYSNDVILKEWRAKIIDALAEKLNENWNTDSALKVIAQFRFVRPRSHMGVRGLRKSAPIHKTTKPDLDKLQRSVGDCIEQSGIARNDSQIVQWDVQKIWAEEHEPPGVVVTITSL